MLLKNTCQARHVLFNSLFGQPNPSTEKKHNINYFCEVPTEIWSVNSGERGREEKGKYIYFASAKQHIWKGNLQQNPRRNPAILI